MDQKLGKKYKLCRQKLIDLVFKTGQVEKQYPFVIYFLESEEKTEAPFQITLSAPKRNFRKAHDRNRIKRLMRETVRKNKFILENYIQTSQKNIILFLIYTSKEELPFEKLINKNELLFENLVKKLTNNEIKNIQS